LSPWSGRPESSLSIDELDAKRTVKRRIQGNIRFIGELAAIGLLPTRVVVDCLNQLTLGVRPTLTFVRVRSLPLLGHTQVESGCADDLELACTLLSVAGKLVDGDLASHQLLTALLSRLALAVHKCSMPPRLRFLLEGVVELRNADWVPRHAVLSRQAPVASSTWQWSSMLVRPSREPVAPQIAPQPLPELASTLIPVPLDVPKDRPAALVPSPAQPIPAGQEQTSERSVDTEPVRDAGEQSAAPRSFASALSAAKQPQQAQHSGSAQIVQPPVNRLLVIKRPMQLSVSVSSSTEVQRAPAHAASVHTEQSLDRAPAQNGRVGDQPPQVLRKLECSKPLGAPEPVGQNSTAASAQVIVPVRSSAVNRFTPSHVFASAAAAATAPSPTSSQSSVSPGPGTNARTGQSAVSSVSVSKQPPRSSQAPAIRPVPISGVRRTGSADVPPVAADLALPTSRSTSPQIRRSPLPSTESPAVTKDLGVRLLTAALHAWVESQRQPAELSLSELVLRVVEKPPSHVLSQWSSVPRRCEPDTVGLLLDWATRVDGEPDAAHPAVRTIACLGALEHAQLVDRHVAALLRQWLSDSARTRDVVVVVAALLRRGHWTWHTMLVELESDATRSVLLPKVVELLVKIGQPAREIGDTLEREFHAFHGDLCLPEGVPSEECEVCVTVHVIDDHDDDGENHDGENDGEDNGDDGNDAFLRLSQFLCR
jgi:hypothetical protein